MVVNGLLCALVWMIVNGIDRMLSWQTLSRPIVTATLTGLFLGDIQTGIIMGASLESIFMGISAIGGSIPADACASSIVAVAFTVLSGADIETGLAVAMPIGTIMASLNEMYKPVLASLAPYWERLAAKGNVKNFRAQVIACGIFIDRLPQAIVLFVAITYGISGLEGFIASMPAQVMAGLTAASGMMTGVGFAILISMIWNKEIGGFFFVGFVLAKYLALPTLPIAILAAVVALMYFYTEKKFTDMRLAIAGTSSKADEEDFF